MITTGKLIDRWLTKLERQQKAPKTNLAPPLSEFIPEIAALEGSEKQIVWGRQVRKKRIEKFLREAFSRYGASTICWPLKYALYLEFLETKKEASWFIGNRDSENFEF